MPWYQDKHGHICGSQEEYSSSKDPRKCIQLCDSKTPDTEISIFTQMILKSDIKGKKVFNKAVEAATIASRTKAIEKIQVAIAARRYMAFQGGSHVNDQLVTVINNISDQLRHSQTAYNAANPTDQTDIAAF
jgi:hypothetical protein